MKPALLVESRCRQDVVGEGAGIGGENVDADQKIQAPKRGLDPGRVRERDDGIPGDHDEGTNPVGIVGQNVVREDRCGRTPKDLRISTDPGGCRIPSGPHLFDQRGDVEGPRIEVDASGSIDISRNGVQCHDSPLGKGGVEARLYTNPGRREGAVRASEGIRSSLDHLS